MVAATPPYQGHERRKSLEVAPQEAQQSFNIPVVVVIIAFIVGLLGLAGWTLKLEQTKADKTEINALWADIKDIQSDVKKLIGRR